MKLTQEELRDSNVIVKVDGKRVLLPVEVDTDAGYCDMQVPKIIDEVKNEAGGLANEGEGVFEYVTRRLTGHIEVLKRGK